MTTLTELVANTRHLEELQLKKIQILRQLTYCVALKLNGVEQKDVAHVIREKLRKKGLGLTTECCIDWTTGNAKQGINQWSMIETKRIVGVVLNDGKVIKFECPIDGWKTS